MSHPHSNSLISSARGFGNLMSLNAVLLKKINKRAVVRIMLQFLFLLVKGIIYFFELLRILTLILAFIYPVYFIELKIKMTKLAYACFPPIFAGWYHGCRRILRKCSLESRRSWRQ